MDGAYLMAFIAQRMRDLDHKEFTFEAVRFYPTGSGGDANHNYIDAANEYYYLVSKTVPTDLKIIGETTVFDEGAAYPNFNFYGIKEFTGRIEVISPTDPIDLEFIQVIPRIPREKATTEETK